MQRLLVVLLHIFLEGVERKFEREQNHYRGREGETNHREDKHLRLSGGQRTYYEPMNALYLCYLSLFDPLVQTQVVAYLEGLAMVGHRIILLTFEPHRPSRSAVQQWQERHAALGIEWHWLRYHKRPTVLATGWDILAGIFVGYRLARRHRIDLLHARGHVPGVMALILKRLTGAKMLFDIRGFMAEEYVDAGIWKAGGCLYRTTKRVERILVRCADGFVVLTKKAKALLNSWYPQEIQGKPLQVIPCCVDLRRVREINRTEPIDNRAPIALAYVGKHGGWYLTEEMIRFFAVARRLLAGLRLQFWTQSNPAQVHSLFTRYGLNGHVTVGQISSHELPEALAKCQAGLSFVRPCTSKLASSPTKVGEYLAVGLPVITTAGIGDVDDLLNGADGHAVGVVVRDFTEEAYADAARELQKLLADPEIRNRCRAAAEEHLDLVRVGWQRYRDIYSSLIG